MSQRLACIYCGSDLTRELYLRNVEKKSTQEVDKIIGLERRCCLFEIANHHEVPFYYGVEMKEEEKKEDLIFKRNK